MASSLTVPTKRYSNAISNLFPNDKRTYKLEAGISGRYDRDILPSNATINSESVTDNYIEFIINGSDQEFIDLDSLSLELKVKITKADGSNIDAATNVTIVDGFGHRLLSKSSVFLNSVQCESNAFYGLYTAVKHYLSLSKDEMAGHGRNMFYKGIENNITHTFTAPNFTIATVKPDERSIQADCVTGIHTIVPLNLELADSGFYLLNGVDMRIRFDLASSAVVIGTDTTEQFKYTILMAKLWVRKVIPHPSALLSLSQNLAIDNTYVEYIYSKPVIKTIVPVSYTHLTLPTKRIV